ncbi:hypothetical protein KPH14_009253 [Odynerus spinipes]|uniref:Methyltransferase HEMK2 n=1 Tax=Odynerus spinipes TaxID=1348599 RepID=A0AAD9RQ14_9HYME|nr:hypothetical protein KPH14_009253 [Odynerus spinipes]
MDTPIVQLSDGDLETVYEPAEDSFILIDALETDLETLKALKPLMCLEIGSGSGVVITALAMALNEHSQGYYIAIDINPNACRSTKRTGRINSVDINVIQMDLLKNLHDDQTFDIIIFNPPYVVTESDEVTETRLVSKTWAGGSHGREVMERLNMTGVIMKDRKVRGEHLYVMRFSKNTNDS